MKELFLITLKIFSEERARHFMGEYHDLLKEYDDARNASHPAYNRDRIALAEQALNRFFSAYSKELEIEMNKDKA